MNKLTKRVISAVLTVVLLLSVMVPCVMAAEAGSYSFLYKNFVTFPTTSSSTGNANLKSADNAQALADAYAAGTVNSMPLYYGLPDNQNPYATDTKLSAGGVVDSWIAIKFKSPGSGSYSVSINHAKESTSPSFGIYILPGDTEESAISNGTALTSEASLGNHNFYTDSAISAGDFKFEGGQEYLVVFKITVLKSGKTSGVFRLISMDMELQEAYEAKVVNAEGNTTYCDTAENALSAAESSSTVVLLNDATVEETLTVKAGVTLDLNGYTLTATSVNAVSPGANVIDSSAESKGVLQGALTASGDNGGYLPISTAANTYKFYAVTVTATNVDTGVENTMKLKFQVKFENDAAYDALETGTSGATIGGIFTWTGNENQMHDITYADDTPLAQKWGQEVVSHDYNKNGSIVLSFSGTEAFEGLTVVPYIQCAGATIKAE